MKRAIVIVTKLQEGSEEDLLSIINIPGMGNPSSVLQGLSPVLRLLTIGGTEQSAPPHTGSCKPSRRSLWGEY